VCSAYTQVSHSKGAGCWQHSNLSVSSVFIHFSYTPPEGWIMANAVLSGDGNYFILRCWGNPLLHPANTLAHSTSRYLCPTCWSLSNHTQNTSGDVAACGMIWAWPVICKSAVKGQHIMENLLEFTICDTLNLCGFTPTSFSLHTHALKTYIANLAVVDTYYHIYSTQLKQTR